MIYSAIFTIILVFYSNYSNIDSIGTANWWIGVGCGIVIIIAWYLEKSIGLLFFIIGIGLLLLGLSDPTWELNKEGRVMLSGVSAGAIITMFVHTLGTWKTFKPFLIKKAKKENVAWLIKILDK